MPGRLGNTGLAGGSAAALEVGRDCALCPRLKDFRESSRRKEPAWFNAPVPSFGPRSARLLIVGLAPGLQGANRTGRPFTGDHAGVLLYDTLAAFGQTAKNGISEFWIVLLATACP